MIHSIILLRSFEEKPKQANSIRAEGRSISVRSWRGINHTEATSLLSRHLHATRAADTTALRMRGRYWCRQIAVCPFIAIRAALQIRRESRSVKDNRRRCTICVCIGTATGVVGNAQFGLCCVAVATVPAIGIVAVFKERIEKTK